jgi:L-amino acid N-acyltransferase YncA
MIQIRPARVGDAEGIVNVLNPLVETGESTALDAVFTAEQERIFIRDFPVQGLFQVAEQTDGGVIVGFQNVEPFATYTAAFAHVGVIGTYVGPSEHRQGIGRLLFEATRRAAKEKGYEKLFGFVRADNVAGLAFYKRIGFEVIGIAKRHAKIKGRYIDEVMIEREV